MKRVIFVASSGGHLSEMLALKNLFQDYEYLLVTEKTEVTLKLKDEYNMDYLKYGPNKNKVKYLLVSIYNVLKCFSLIIKFKPETILTTGAQVGGMMCFVGKLLRKKIIYIESIARVEELSTTGSAVYKFADKFYVQWEKLSQKYEKAEFIGRLV